MGAATGAVHLPNCACSFTKASSMAENDCPTCGARNRENVDMYETVKNVEYKHGSVATCDIIDDFENLDEYPRYHIIRVSPNYHYDIEQDNNNYSNRPHKSPIEHYRKGTPIIDTVYSRRSTIVNKGNSDSSEIYSL